MVIQSSDPTGGITEQSIQTTFASSPVAKGGVTWGKAKGYWLELKPVPPGTPKRLWFKMEDGQCCVWDNPDDESIETVQRAFCFVSYNEVIVYHSGTMVFVVVVRTPNIW